MAATPTQQPTAAALQQRVDALTRHFARVQAERMAGIPLLNSALCVEAVGFEWAAQTEDDARRLRNVGAHVGAVLVNHHKPRLHGRHDVLALILIMCGRLFLGHACAVVSV